MQATILPVVLGLSIVALMALNLIAWRQAYLAAQTDPQGASTQMAHTEPVASQPTAYLMCLENRTCP